VKGKYPLTTPKLHRLLLELLRHPEVHVEFGHMTAQQGFCEWLDIFPPTDIRIRVDANQQTGNIDHIGTVVHELLHVVLFPISLGWFADDLDEALVLAMDAHMVAYIRKSPKRVHTWTELIDTKIKESDAASS